MAKIALIVEYELKPGQGAKFLQFIRDHAAYTLKEEVGCLRFEITAPLDKNGDKLADHVLLSELYADMDALKVHQKSPRLATMREATADLVAGRKATIAEIL